MPVTWEDDFFDTTKIKTAPDSRKRIVHSTDAGIIKGDRVIDECLFQTAAEFNAFFDYQSTTNATMNIISGQAALANFYYLQINNVGGIGGGTCGHRYMNGADYEGGWNNWKASVYLYVNADIRDANAETFLEIYLSPPDYYAAGNSQKFRLGIKPSIDANNFVAIPKSGANEISTGIVFPTDDCWVKLTIERIDGIIYYRISDGTGGAEETSDVMPRTEENLGLVYSGLIFWDTSGAGTQSAYFDVFRIESYLEQEDDDDTWPDHQQQFETVDITPANFSMWRTITVDKSGESLEDDKFISISVLDSGGSVISGFDNRVEESINIKSITETTISLLVKFWNWNGYTSPTLDKLTVTYDVTGGDDAVTLSVTANTYNNDITTPINSKTGYRLTFQATAQEHDDPDVSVTHYWFDFGDGMNSNWITYNIVNHIYNKHSQNVSEAGSDQEWNARVKVKYSDGSISGWSNLIDVNVANENPIPKLWIKPLSSRMQEGGVSEYIYFYGDDSFDVDDNGLISTSGGYKFDFGDGTSETWQDEAYATHIYSNSGTYIVGLTVKDDLGAESDKLLTKVFIKPQLVSTLIVFNRHPKQVSMSHSSDYQITTTIAGGFPEVEPLTSKNRTIKISGQAHESEVDITLIRGYVENQTFVKFQYYDLSNSLVNFTGYILDFQITRSGGFKDDVPWNATIQYLEE